jgi:transposase
VASWVLTPPGKLADDSRAALAQITARCEELNATRALARDFADMLCHRHGEHLEAWASHAENSPVSELRGFAKGLRKDWAAVTAGLTVPYSSNLS